MKTALSIAGTDPSGGAGIQADLKTMTMNGVFAMSAITALVAQNTTGVKEIVEMSPAFLEAQIDAVFEDIPPDAVKIGMVVSCGLIEKIAERLSFYQARNIVVDPVMVATSGDRLIDQKAADMLNTCLLPLAAVATPNIPEAEILSGMAIRSREEYGQFRPGSLNRISRKRTQNQSDNRTDKRRRQTIYKILRRVHPLKQPQKILY